MKAIFTLLFVLTIGLTAQAQDTTEEIEVQTIETNIVAETVKENVLDTKVEMARLYKFKNSRVKKALSFTTKRNKAKMA